MRSIIYSFLLVAVFGLCSCEKHLDTIDVSFQVGSIVCRDGSVVHRSQYSDEMNAVGVVFWVNDKNIEDREVGYAVALSDIEPCLMIDTLSNISAVSESMVDFDGRQNTVAIYNYAVDYSRSAPAVEHTINYSPYGFTGWYIPSVGEMSELCRTQLQVNDVLSSINGSTLDGWYWTSTEDGSGDATPTMYMNVCEVVNSRFTSSKKTNYNKVRAIIPIR